MSVDEYLQQIYYHFQTLVLEPQQLSPLLLPDPMINRRLPALQQELQRYGTPQQLNALINANNGRNEIHALNNLVAALLRYIRDVAPSSKLASVDLVVEYFQALCTAFNNPKLAPKLTLTVVEMTKFAMALCKQCDRATGGGENGFPRLTFLKSALTSVFTGVVMEMKQEFTTNPNYVIDPALHPTDRKCIIVFLVNQLCRVYFTIGAPMSCANIFLNLRTIPLAWGSFSLALQLEYKYWLGRYYLINQNLVQAYDALKWAWDHCPHVPGPNHTRILRYLVPCGLVLGKKLNFNSVLADRTILQLYQPLYHHLARGNIYAFNAHLHQHEAIFTQHQVLTLLVSKTQILIVRNLFRKIYLNLGASPKLHYDALLVGLRVAATPSLGQPPLPALYDFFSHTSGQTGPQNDLLLENILVALIDQGLMKAHIFNSLRLANCAKTDDKAWVHVPTVYRTRFVQKQ
ncbi:hypothetical protein BABINDRAFT_161673 [Babjeviella inositovora NRRL Y-12698]|uniref:Uncharacterized protein n=1 Tax=Babjeviella inositovora NRRL Y-12698 TaxID=984486 RepID=A0A1E3QQS9_9ASCO|nr:uncharacterized protein BABINDRAFT_161673 [Babjeviella inositovora NRRL Y-12698]ODQ80031.1 hypothetical protein BABINDRAFT_161673 [Babjeviella inositovora NRRL Y-12698]